jgi:hypothetical protein
MRRVEGTLSGTTKHQRQMGPGAAMKQALNQFEVLWEIGSKPLFGKAAWFALSPPTGITGDRFPLRRPSRQEANARTVLAVPALAFRDGRLRREHDPRTLSVQGTGWPIGPKKRGVYTKSLTLPRASRPAFPSGVTTFFVFLLFSLQSLPPLPPRSRAFTVLW